MPCRRIANRKIHSYSSKTCSNWRPVASSTSYVRPSRSPSPSVIFSFVRTALGPRSLGAPSTHRRHRISCRVVSHCFSSAPGLDPSSPPPNAKCGLYMYDVWRSCQQRQKEKNGHVNAIVLRRPVGPCLHCCSLSVPTWRFGNARNACMMWSTRTRTRVLDELRDDERRRSGVGVRICGVLRWRVEGCVLGGF